MSLSSTIGNIKRKYATDNFNPFLAMSFIYDRCLSRGPGTTVLVVGHSKRFQEDIVKAWWHVMADRKILRASKDVRMPEAGFVTTHTGTRLKFVGIDNKEENVSKFNTEVQEAQIVVVCDKYTSPSIKSVMRFSSSAKNVYDVSTNNPKKVVDKKDSKG